MKLVAVDYIYIFPTNAPILEMAAAAAKTSSNYRDHTANLGVGDREESMRFRSLLGHRPGLLVLPVRPPSYFSYYNSGEGGSSERSDICYILQRAKQYN